VSFAQRVKDDLEELAESGSTVTVALDNDRVYTGSVALHPTDPLAFVIKTGRRGRPPVFYPDQVTAVIAE